MPTPLKSLIKEGDVTVLVIPNNQYTKTMVDISKYFAKNSSTTCYVSLNKPFGSLSNSLKQAKVDTKKFLFIDGITKSANPDFEESENCIYISSSSALTEMGIAIGKAIGTGKFDGFLFDSLSTLLIYNKSEVVCKFLHSIVNKVKAKNMTAVFTALEGDTGSQLLKEAGMFVDNIENY